MDVLKVRRLSAAKLIPETDGAHFFKIPSYINDFQFHFSSKFSFIEYFVQLIVQLCGGSGIFTVLFVIFFVLH